MYYRSPRRRRRINTGLILRVLSIVLAVLIFVLAVTQTMRARKANATIDALNQKVTELQGEVDRLEELVPEVMLNADMSGETLPYQSLYPDMVVDPLPVFTEQPEKTAYLTFDDGPSANTYTILDALKESGQKATFFIVAKNIPGHEDALKRMAAEGHTIAIHTYAHDYKAIYASVEDYLDDFNKAYTAIYEACGVKPTLFRFPGGSLNSYNRPIYQQLIAEMLRRGFVYYDWSVSSEDATGKDYTPAELTQFVMDGTAKVNKPIILMHDSGEKKNTAAAVPEIIRQLTAQGYTCAPLTGEVKPVTFGYK